jgi:enamine deaminase RidA (YjgF/YER057c/UK114 family)
MKLYMLALLAGFWACSAVSAQAQDKTPEESPGATPDSLMITGHGKTAIIANKNMKKWSYDGVYHFSPGVRAGDYIFLSGVVSGAFGDELPINKEQFKETLRRSFAAMEAILLAANADMNSIVKITTYHVFDSPLISIDKSAQVQSVAEVKSEFMDEPHSAWTAIGATALLPDKGLVEIDVVAYAPLTSSEN